MRTAALRLGVVTVRAQKAVAVTRVALALDVEEDSHVAAAPGAVLLTVTELVLEGEESLFGLATAFTAVTIGFEEVASEV